ARGGEGTSCDRGGAEERHVAPPRGAGPPDPDEVHAGTPVRGGRRRRDRRTRRGAAPPDPRRRPLGRDAVRRRSRQGGVPVGGGGGVPAAVPEPVEPPPVSLDGAFGAAAAVLADATEVALACHVNPDPDALGSMLGLSAFLRSRGVRTVCSYGNEPFE